MITPVMTSGSTIAATMNIPKNPPKSNTSAA